MEADGALNERLRAYVEVVFGTQPGGPNGATTLVDLLTAKTARELAVDVSPDTAPKR